MRNCTSKRRKSTLRKRKYDTLEHENSVKINQLKKLVDYLQIKMNKGNGNGNKKSKSIFGVSSHNKEDKENLALPYEVLKDKCVHLENKNRDLVKELNNAKSQLQSTTKSNTAIVLPSSSHQHQILNHSIPHRWINQTNMKVTKMFDMFHKRSILSPSVRSVNIVHKTVHVSLRSKRLQRLRICQKISRPF